MAGSTVNQNRIMHAPQPQPEPIPVYFPLSADYSVGQARPMPLAPNRYGHGAMDGRVFQFATDMPDCLACKAQIMAEYASEHVARDRLPEQALAAVGSFIAQRLAMEYSLQFAEADLAGQSFEALAMVVPEDLAITCVDDRGTDWLAALHVCMPSGWSPRDMIGRSFGQVHRTVQVANAKHFLLEDGKVKDYVGQMMACTQPHVRFIWTLQCGDARNRNPQTRRPADRLELDTHTGQTNAFFRVERQTITSFPEAGASLFTIRTYLYPLDDIIAVPAHRAALREAMIAMPRRVVRYKGLDEQLVNYVRQLS